MRSVLTPQRAAVAVVALVAAAAFSLSWHALTLGAARSGAVPADLAWLVPIVIDGLQLAAYLAIVARALRGVRAPGPWAGVILAAAASIAGNVAAAPPTAAARLWSAVAPLALLCALRFLESEYRLAAQRAQLANADPATRARAVWHAEELAGGRRLAARELAERVGVPRRTAADWLARWRTAEPAPAPPELDGHRPESGEKELTP